MNRTKRAVRQSAPAFPARRGIRAVSTAAFAAALVVLAGCVTAWTPDFNSPNPPDQTAAILEVVDRYRPFEDSTSAEVWAPPWSDDSFCSDVAWLVVMLQSSDPGVRVLAIEALDRLVEERHGYDASAPWSERVVAIAAWAEFLHQNGYVGEPPLPPVGLLPPPQGDADA